MLCSHDCCSLIADVAPPSPASPFSLTGSPSLKPLYEDEPKFILIFAPQSTLSLRMSLQEICNCCRATMMEFEINMLEMPLEKLSKTSFQNTQGTLDEANPNKTTVLHMNRNDYYGGESTSLHLTQLWKHFRGSEQPPKSLGSSGDYNVDSIPKVVDKVQEETKSRADSRFDMDVFRNLEGRW